MSHDSSPHMSVFVFRRLHVAGRGCSSPGCQVVRLYSGSALNTCLNKVGCTAQSCNCPPKWLYGGLVSGVSHTPRKKNNGTQALNIRTARKKKRINSSPHIGWCHWWAGDHGHGNHEDFHTFLKRLHTGQSVDDVLRHRHNWMESMTCPSWTKKQVNSANYCCDGFFCCCCWV